MTDWYEKSMRTLQLAGMSERTQQWHPRRAQTGGVLRQGPGSGLGNRVAGLLPPSAQRLRRTPYLFGYGTNL